MAIRTTGRRVIASALLLLVGSSSAFAAAPQVPKTDFVFIVDATGSMGGEIAAVRAGLSGFVAGLNAFNVDPRFAIVLYGGAPELVLDFTSDTALVQAAFGMISVGGAVSGFQNNHNVNPESGLEAIRQVLGQAIEPLNTDNLPGHSGVLDYRVDARKNIILVTDEDSDRPFHVANQFPGQAANEPPSGCPGLDAAWQAEVDATASAAINQAAFVNLLVNAGDQPSTCQYGDPSSDVSDVDLLNFDAAGTLANLVAAGFGDSLEGQLLAAGLVGRAFSINDVNDPTFVNNFFAAKVEENNPFFFCVGSGCPCGNDAPSPIAGCANSTGQGALLAATGSVSVSNDDLVLTVSDMPTNQFGLVLLGPGSQSCVTRSDGFLGVQPGPPGSIMFLSVESSGPSGTFSAGPNLVADVASQFGSMGMILSGDTWFFQVYYRDSFGSSPCGGDANFSNAIGVRFSN